MILARKQCMDEYNAWMNTIFAFLRKKQVITKCSLNDLPPSGCGPCIRTWGRLRGRGWGSHRWWRTPRTPSRWRWSCRWPLRTFRVFKVIEAKDWGGKWIHFTFGIEDCQILLRFFESNKTRSKTTDEGGNPLDDRAVQNGHGQVRRAHLCQTLEHNRYQVEMLLSLTFLHCKLRSGSDQHGSRRFRDPKEFESPCKEEFLAWIKQNHISNRR